MRIWVPLLVSAYDAELCAAVRRIFVRLATRPIKVERLSLDPDGRVIYALRRHWRDGTSTIAFDPLRPLASVPCATCRNGRALPCLPMAGLAARERQTCGGTRRASAHR